MDLNIDIVLNEFCEHVMPFLYPIAMEKQSILLRNKIKLWSIWY
jgi:hypothetical protein